MTAATFNRAFPYPEDDDILGNGYATIQALAEALDTWTPKKRARVTVASVHNAVAASAITGIPAWAVRAGWQYQLEAHLWITSAVATTGPRPGLVAAAGMTATDLTLVSQLGLAGNTIESPAPVTAMGGLLAHTASVVAGSLLIVRGTVKVNAAGTIQLMMASEVAASAVTVAVGSWATLEETN